MRSGLYSATMEWMEIDRSVSFIPGLHNLSTLLVLMILLYMGTLNATDAFGVGIGLEIISSIQQFHITKIVIASFKIRVKMQNLYEANVKMIALERSHSASQSVLNTKQ